MRCRRKPGRLLARSWEGCQGRLLGEVEGRAEEEKVGAGREVKREAGRGGRGGVAVVTGEAGGGKEGGVRQRHCCNGEGGWKMSRRRREGERRRGEEGG